MPPVTETLTIHLPAAAAERLRRVAAMTHRSIDDIVVATLQVNLPPLLENMPPAFRDELAALETLSTDALWQQWRVTLNETEIAHYDALLAENATDGLDAAKSQELMNLRNRSDQLMFRKAYVALLLKWRGERLPTLAELETR